jgi:Flp pilus assembly secretin CpaC
MGILLHMTKRQRNRVGIFGLLMVAGLPFSGRTARAQWLAAVPTLGAQAEVPATQSATPLAQPLQANQEQESGAPQTLHLLVGRSLVITSPNRIKRVSLADPAIAEAVVVSPTQLVINGKSKANRSRSWWTLTFSG